MTSRDNKPISIEPSGFEAPSAKNDDIQSSASSTLGTSNGLSNSIVSNPALLVKKGAPWWHSQFNMMLCAFALLAAMSLLVVALIPKPEASSVNIVLTSTGESRLSRVSISESEDSNAPWDERRRQQARSDAQDILSELLILKKDLEAMDVIRWAKEEFGSALAQADAGDEYYKNKNFAKALNSYSDARAALQRLDEFIPKELSQRVVAGNDALKEGKSSLAKEKFQHALILDQNHIPALRGLDKANSLDRLLALVESAELDEQDFANKDDVDSLISAEQKYQQALAFDSQSNLVNEGQQRVAQKLLDKRYRLAMSNGFNALFSGRFNQAKHGFSKALSLKPNDATAMAAYRQSLASDKRSSLSSLINNAKVLEKNEDWSQALSTYQAILQRDPNQISAKLGVIRSRARNELDQSIQELLQDTLALSKASQRVEAEQIVNDARAIKRKGTVLKSQIVELEAVFKGLDTSLKVEFRSDTFTDVYLVKVGSKKIKLGTFAQKKMALKPGRYVLSGSRLGYVDVRHEIDLHAGSSDVIKLLIACETPINASVVGEQS